MTDNVVVPLRKMEVYQADDGRRVEVFNKIDTVPYLKRQEQDDDTPEFSDLSAVYIGVVHVMTNHGPKEIKFQIPHATSIVDAFSQYYTLADEAISDLEKKIEEAHRKSQSQVITAPASVLNDIEVPGNDEGHRIII